MITTFLLLGSLAVAQADQPADADLELQVRRLVRQLDSDELATRQQAEAALIELGPGVLDLLPPVRSSTSAEVKVRIERIRSALQKTAAAKAASSSTVTLSGELSLSDALAAIEQQTGNKFIDFRRRFNQQQPDPKVDVNFDATPFWPAVDELFDQAGITVYNFGGEPGALSLVQRNEGDAPRKEGAFYAGVFRFEPLRMQATRDLRNPANTSLRCTIEVAWEPRLTPIVLQFPLADLQVADESGQPLKLAGQGRATFSIGPQPNLPASELVLPMELPPRDVKTIAKLDGALRALVPGRVEKFAFDNLDQAKRVERTVAGATVTLDQVRKNLELYEVRLRVQFDDAASALESHRGWVYNNPAYLLDPEGNRIENVGMQQTGASQNQVGVAYLFDREEGLAGCRFVYETPAKIIQMPVEFQMRDIPLP